MFVTKDGVSTDTFTGLFGVAFGEVLTPCLWIALV